MLVCHCKALYDSDIVAAIDAGACDEFDVAESCGAGTACGGCVPAVTALLAEHCCAPGCPVVGVLRRAAAERVPVGVLQGASARSAGSGVRRRARPDGP